MAHLRPDVWSVLASKRLAVSSQALEKILLLATAGSPKPIALTSITMTFVGSYCEVL